MAKITIDNMTYNGKNITITNGEIKIDGRSIDINNAISIIVEGNIDKLQVDACNKVEVNGQVNSLNTMSGDVEVTGDIEHYIKTQSGDITINGGVIGDVSSMSGDIEVKTNKRIKWNKYTF